MKQAATAETPEIAPGKTVTLHMQVRFQDGFIALSTFDEDPLVCMIGDGTLTPALESSLQGLAAGSDTHIVANGSDLFAPYDESNRHWIDRDQFPPDLTPAPGQVIAFATPGGHELSGIVMETDGGRVRMDLNHPFAGRDLTLRVKVLSVR